MQLATMLGQILESGKVTLSTKNKEDLEITAANKKIDANVKNKQFIKEIIATVREAGKKVNVTETVKESPGLIRTAMNMRELLADVAEELKEAGITITLSYEGDVVATIGSDANSKISRLVTGTKAVEINSLPKLVELGI